jgi:hypothetical protein
MKLRPVVGALAQALSQLLAKVCDLSLQTSLKA